MMRKRLDTGVLKINEENARELEKYRQNLATDRDTDVSEKKNMMDTEDMRIAVEHWTEIIMVNLKRKYILHTEDTRIKIEPTVHSTADTGVDLGASVRANTQH